MAITLWLLPIISALIGWGTNVLAVKLLFYPRKPWGIGSFSIQGVIPRRQKELAARLAHVVANELLTREELSQKLEAVQIESEVQNILNHRIDLILHRFRSKNSMAGLFLTEKVTGVIKKLIIDEVLDELPLWKKTLVERVVDHLHLYEWVEQKVLSFDVERMEQIVMSAARHELHVIEWLGAVVGFAIGLVQLAIVLMAS